MRLLCRTRLSPLLTGKRRSSATGVSVAASIWETRWKRREGEWGVTLKAEYFRLIKDGGFDAVRIPIRWSAHAAGSAPYTIEPAFSKRVDWAIDQALSQGLQVMINVHHYEAIVKDPDGHTERFLGLWSQIADHYKDYPEGLLFELLNEPTRISSSCNSPQG